MLMIFMRKKAAYRIRHGLGGRSSAMYMQDCRTYFILLEVQRMIGLHLALWVLFFHLMDSSYTSSLVVIVAISGIHNVSVRIKDEGRV
jgi:hypothetical protein